MSGRYQIIGTLGRGGIGTVYRANDTYLNREVAIKRLLPLEKTNLNEVDSDSLMREASALAKFQHPNVVTIFAFEEDDEGSFVVMELIEGENLKQIVEKGALAVDDFEEFVSQILDPLITAQQMDLLHRDIKPQNLMLLFLPSGRFQVKVLDFGLAKFSEKPSAQTLDQTGSFLGSIDYIAPEQIRTRPLDQRTDLYSFGCVCYFALTQKAPFTGKNMAETMDNHLKHRVTPIFDYRSDLPPAIGAWVMRLISKEPSQRPQNATEANAEFERAKRGIAPQMSGDCSDGPYPEHDEIIEVTPMPAINSPAAPTYPETGAQPTVSGPVPPDPSATGAHLPGSTRRILTGASSPIKTTTGNPGHLKRRTALTPKRRLPTSRGLPAGAIAGIAAAVVLIPGLIFYFAFKKDGPELPIAKGPTRGPGSSDGNGKTGGHSGKPVKVYILSGQENMVGNGEVGPLGMNRFDTFVSKDSKAERGMTLSVYRGAYSASRNYGNEKPLSEHHFKVGYWPHENFEDGPKGPTTQIARGFFRIAGNGEYSFIAGDILEVDGKEVFRNRDGNPTSKPIKLKAGTYPVKITYFGNARTIITHKIWNTPGTLTTLVKRQGKYPFLLDGKGNWARRDDVWYKGLITAQADRWLGVGCGSGSKGAVSKNGDKTIGPELGFGHVVGDFHDEPVLLIKASQGDRSLGWDFLPPESKRFEYRGKTYAGYKDKTPSWEKSTNPKPINGYAGKQFDDCFSAVHDALDNFDRSFPQLAGRKYEIAGFVWWQGNKDGSPPYAERYEQNLVNLIKTLRKEFNAPRAPFVIGTLGFGGWNLKGSHKIVADAQLAVSGSQGNYPEFRDNVLTVETRGFWHSSQDSPKNQHHSYNQNSGTYVDVGQALGKGMVELQKKAGK